MPTKLNASDLPSRGCLLSELKTSQMWIKGPEFIREKEIPLFEYNQSVTVDAELKGSCLLSMEEGVESKSTGYLPKDYFKYLRHQPKLHEIIDISRFSDVNRLLRVTAYILRFTCRDIPVEKKSKLITNSSGNLDSIEFNKNTDENSDVKNVGKISKEKNVDNLTTEEIQKAKFYWIGSEQRKNAMEDKENFTKTGNNLSFFLEDCVIRCKGRVKNSDLPYNSKFPIFYQIILLSLH